MLRQAFVFLFKLKKKLAALGLCCCTQAFPSCVRGLLILVASLVVEHRLQGVWVSVVEACGSVIVARGLQYMCSVAVAHRLCCPSAWGILVPWVGIESMSPALACGFLTSGQPVKSWGIWFCIVNYSISTFNNRCVLATSCGVFQRWCCHSTF